jgi:hypothetical protein
MIVATVCFGSDPTFWSMLNDWAEAVEDAVPQAKRVLITGGLYGSSHVCNFDAELCVTPDESLIRDSIDGDGVVTAGQGRNFDLKGALLLAALPLLGGDLLYLDADAVLMKDPSMVLKKLRTPMHIAENRFAERVLDKECHVMGCAGVMWFPAAGYRRLVVDGYREAFERHRSSADPLVEQYCWSLAAGHAEKLPVTMNAPRHSKDAYVEHWCGDKYLNEKES